MVCDPILVGIFWISLKQRRFTVFIDPLGRYNRLVESQAPGDRCSVYDRNTTCVCDSFFVLLGVRWRTDQSIALHNTRMFVDLDRKRLARFA